MKHMGEDDASTEGAKLSGAWKSGGTVCGHNSGESLEWAPKVQRCAYTHPYLSGQWTEQSLCDGAIAYHMSLTFTGVFFVYSGFLFAYK